MALVLSCMFPPGVIPDAKGDPGPSGALSLWVLGPGYVRRTFQDDKGTHMTGIAEPVPWRAKRAGNTHQELGLREAHTELTAFLSERLF